MKSHCFFIGTTLADNPVPHHFVALSEELVKRGHRVVMLAPHRRTDLEDPSGNPAIYTWPSDRPTKLRDGLFLRRLIQQYKPDCLIANFAAVNMMSLVGWLMRVPGRVVWYHTLSTQIALDGQIPAWRLRLLRLRKELAYMASTHIVPVSQAAYDDLAHLYPAQKPKARVYLNALADPLPKLGSRNGATVPRLVCVARFFPSKGQDVLIRAVALLKEKHRALTVEFVGIGPALDRCLELARELGVAERCAFAGRVEHDEVLRRMATATATVLPSRSDNCPLVAIESLAVGTPLVGSRVGGIPEIVRDGVDGFLVPPDDPQTLATKLDEILSRGDLQRTLRANARAGFLTRFEQRGAVVAQADWLEGMVSSMAKQTAAAW